ncbi:MAG: DUF86 domain-containing protein [Oscillospiraceae bacterium]|nr:DUF86 domain-containing protein [Oscillospiraceae bacterium]
MIDKDILRIQRIKEYCEEINETVERFGVDYSVFIGDKDYYKSISMSIMQIGELSNGLTEVFKETTQNEIPWSAMRNVRNLFAHEYTKVDKETIWETLNSEIPELHRFCENILEKEKLNKSDVN